MDGSRFDDLTKTLAGLHSRRTTLGAVLAGVLAPLGALAAPEDARKKKKKRKKGCLANGRICGQRRGRKRGQKNHDKCARCCSKQAERRKKARRCVGRADGASCTNNNQCASGLCRNGVCRPADCDVCPSGCEFANVQDAVDAAAAGATIQLCPGTYVGSTTIDKDLTLVGSGQNNTILDGDGTASVVALSGSPTVQIQDLTITGGNSSGVGGGISNGNATTTLLRVNITGNTAGTRGGGIDINGPGDVTLIDSSVTDNEAGTLGGGIFNLGTLELIRSSVTDNTAADEGGGIVTATGATTTIDDDSVIADNDPDNCVNEGTVNGTCPP